MPSTRQALRDAVADHGPVAIRYGIVGLSGYALSLLIFAAQIEAGIPAYAAVPAGFVVNTLWNFTLNRAWSFPRSNTPVGQQLRRFWVVALVTLAANYVVLYVLHGLVGMAAVPSQALAIACIVPIGYLAQRYWAFSAG